MTGGTISPYKYNAKSGQGKTYVAYTARGKNLRSDLRMLQIPRGPER